MTKIVGIGWGDKSNSAQEGPQENQSRSHLSYDKSNAKEWWIYERQENRTPRMAKMILTKFKWDQCKASHPRGKAERVVMQSPSDNQCNTREWWICARKENLKLKEWMSRNHAISVTLTLGAVRIIWPACKPVHILYIKRLHSRIRSQSALIRPMQFLIGAIPLPFGLWKHLDERIMARPTTVVDGPDDWRTFCQIHPSPATGQFVMAEPCKFVALHGNDGRYCAVRCCA